MDRERSQREYDGDEDDDDEKLEVRKENRSLLMRRSVARGSVSDQGIAQGRDTSIRRSNSIGMRWREGNEKIKISKA